MAFFFEHFFILNWLKQVMEAYNVEAKAIFYYAGHGIPDEAKKKAYPYKEQRHGMFTYYLLKKLQKTKGEATLGEICDYVTSEVRKQSIVINGKMQTPTLTSSSAIGDAWRNWILK